VGIVLQSTRLTLRAGRPGEERAVLQILREPAIAERWGRFSINEVAEQFIGSEVAFLIEIDGRIAGAIQYHEEDDPQYRHAGMDIFLSTAHQGRGLRSDAVRVLARYLITERGHHRLTIDPAADNLPAIRAYERAGFRAVGIMRRYEKGLDGEWHDGLLMDLLADELQDAPADP
jgi:aminoglycoside 6'-N-acetyltransferase